MLKTKKCYLCRGELEQPVSFDHIIPDNLYVKDDPNRPKLLVHHTCNTSKSTDDTWFVKHLYLRCGFNSMAEKSFSDFMDQATYEKRDAYLIGKRPRSYVLARRIFDNAIWGLEIVKDGRRLHQLRFSEKETTRFINYVKNMCTGLFIKNVEDAEPQEPEIRIRQYADLDLHGGRGSFLESISKLYNASKSSLFEQKWENERVTYFGSRVAESPNKGFLFIEFYGELGILVAFI